MKSLKGAMVHPDHRCIGASWLWADASCFLKIKCHTSAPALPLLGCPSSSCKTGSGSRCSPLWLVRTMVTWFASATRTSGPESTVCCFPAFGSSTDGNGLARRACRKSPEYLLNSYNTHGKCDDLWWVRCTLGHTDTTQMLQDAVSAIKWITIITVFFLTKEKLKKDCDTATWYSTRSLPNVARRFPWSHPIVLLPVCS